MPDTVVIRSSEICLKGGNRGYFEKKLAEEVLKRADRAGEFEAVRSQGGLFLLHRGPIGPAATEELERGLSAVFGIGHFAFARRCARTVEAIRETAATVVRGSGAKTFKIETRREDKSFPLKSPEISRAVGGHVLKTVPGPTVDVHAPDLVVRVDVGRKFALVESRRLPGPGGLPVGSSGKVAVLLSGGIDSPVAAWKMMRRGCRAVFIHFHSYPYVGAGSMDKAKRLAAALDRYQFGSTLYLVPLSDAQREIAAKADPAMRVVLYRRMMLRIAERLARKEGALALATGDSVGQVASQTLENIAAVSAAAGVPVLRPLIGENKEDIIALAKEIGTYDISIERHDDCCSLFMPPNPATRATAARAEREEAKYDVAALAAGAAARTERFVITTAGENAKIIL